MKRALVAVIRKRTIAVDGSMAASGTLVDALSL
jgi:hypothetical protein